MGNRSRSTVAVLMVDGADLFETSVPISVFGLDRTASGAPAFEVLSVAAEPGPLTMTTGVQLVAPYRLEDLDRAGVVVIPSWRAPAERPPEHVLEAIVAAHAGGALIVSLCTGAFVLAASGLLDGRRAATNWYHADALQQLYPEVRVDSSVLFVDHGDVVASAGCTAGVDACLHVVRRLWGAQAALAIARRMVVPPLRAGGQAQFIDRPLPEAVADDGIATTIAYAQEHLDESLDPAALARRAGMSRRSFDRRFRDTMGTSITQWLLQQRVLRAQRLLENTDLSVDRIARDVGLSTGVTLRPHFRKIVGVSPQRYRETFRLAETGTPVAAEIPPRSRTSA
ncbi:helix-turn-helix domain-containing protein [Kribbella shirazensis]|uniref:Transcriptional regulator GlxA family with amidase domain n=1 Tax=Kribbella shirazensis TaxID=1105143 RepID=A0A7X6A4H5_9ACTN|nr:helix-turn-helix domain-containing protein [Kribbella shirazensis]NIK61517.1 transcriptional regulator GlxA family with amidase domain [Kribbella shirazensis]